MVGEMVPIKPGRCVGTRQACAESPDHDTQYAERSRSPTYLGAREEDSNGFLFTVGFEL